MKSILYTLLMVVIWTVNLLTGTGLGNAYHTTEYARLIVYFFAILIVISEINNIKGIYVDYDILYSFGAVFILFVLVAWYKGYGLTSLNYLWAFVLIYVVGKMPVTKRAMKLTSFAFGILGIVILCIYDYGTRLSGWNSNSIGMIGLYSFLFFCIPYFKPEKFSDKLILIIVAGIYSYLISPTNSRSSILFAIVAILFALSVISGNLIIGNKRRIILVLLVPLLVAVFVVIVAETGLLNSLNSWSIEKYQKSLFNGRDIIWSFGLSELKNSLIFGTGFIHSGYWHNCAIGCLYAFGVLGYSFWIYSLYIILCKSLNYLNDPIVFGCAISFLVLFVQQSVELGFFAQDPNLLPYLMLGILIGRVKVLRRTYSVRSKN